MDPDLELRGAPVLTGHLTGCGSADLHNSPTSASLGHFSAQDYKIAAFTVSKKATANYPQIRSKNSEETDHFEEVIHPKQRPKHAFLFVNNFEPPGIPCIFW